MLTILLGVLCVQAQEPDPELANKENPRLKVLPVEEPELLIDEKSETRPGFVAALPNGGGFVFDRKDAAGRRTTGVAVPGIVLVTKGMVELFGCGAGGKEHETVLRLECDVQSLDMALTSAGFRRGKLPSKSDVNEAGQGSRVIILIQWTGPDGKPVTHRSEDLVVSVQRNAPMPRVGWTYVGHWAEVPDPLDPKGAPKKRVLAAVNTQSYVTTFRDRSALLDNPLEEAVDDTLFAANYMILPKPGTPVRVIFRSPSETERKDIAALEKVIAAEAKAFHEDDRDQKKK